jgi:DHA1 family bicyclomycin/chloramphenicol resistance-like MFS transporter
MKKSNQYLQLIIIFVTIAYAIGLEMSAPSLFSIKNYFNATEKLSGMTITFHFIGILISSLIYGPISDSIGRKKILIIGLIIANIGGIMCVFSNSIYMLIFARLIQGIGISSVAVIVPTIISESYDQKDSAKFFRLNLACMTLFTAVAPVIGGFINNKFGWRENYLFVFIFQFLSLFLIFFAFEETLINKINKIDIRNILYKYLSIIKAKNFIFCSIVPVLLYSSYVGFISYTAFLYIDLFKFTDIQYSFSQLMILGAFALTNLLLSFVKYRYQYWEKKIIYLGLLLIFLGYFSIFFAKTANILTFLMMIALVGQAIISPLFFAKSYTLISEKGTASSFIGILRSFSVVLFTFFASYFYNKTILNIAIILSISSLLVLFFIIILFKNNLFKKNE